MTPLVRFLAVNLLCGFALGAALGLAVMAFVAAGLGYMLTVEPLASAMLIWGLGASVGVGYFATALACLRDERDGGGRRPIPGRPLAVRILAGD